MPKIKTPKIINGLAPELYIMYINTVRNISKNRDRKIVRVIFLIFPTTTKPPNVFQSKHHL